jgi:hypothetical protein
MGDGWGGNYGKARGFLVNNTVIGIEGVRLAFTSLWTRIGPTHQQDIASSMNDFSVIRFGGQRLTVEQVNSWHVEIIWFLNEVFEDRSGMKTIVGVLCIC